MTQNPWDLAANVSRLLEFRRARDWEQFHRPKELVAGISIEAGELQELFLWRDPETPEQVTGQLQRMTRIEEELADVAIYTLLLAHDLGIDLRSAIDRKITLNEQRYDVSRSKGRSDKAPERAPGGPS